MTHEQGHPSGVMPLPLVRLISAPAAISAVTILGPTHLCCAHQYVVTVVVLALDVGAGGDQYVDGVDVAVGLALVHAFHGSSFPFRKNVTNCNAYKRAPEAPAPGTF